MNTESVNAFIQLKAFARIAGLKMTILWIASFACFVAQFHEPSFSLLWLVSIILIPYIMTRQTRTYRSQIDGGLSFRRSWTFSAYTFFYASILFALAQYIYFAFVDHGFIINQYVQALSDPASATLLASYGYTQGEIKMIVNQMLEIKPINIAFNCATINIITGLLLAIPIAALTRRSAPADNHITEQRQ